VSSWFSIIGLVLDIAGVIGLGVYTARGSTVKSGWGYGHRGPWWGWVSGLSWLSLVLGFALQLVAQLVTK
jgi:hypothetical protein